MNWYTQRPVPGVSLPAIMVDMAPVSAAPQPTQMDLAPGPVMQQADASPPEPASAEAVQEQIAPTPPQEKPEVVAPPEQKPEPTPPKPEPAKAVPESEADAGKAESGSRGRQEADRRAAGAAHDRLAQGRTPGAGRVRRQRRRIGGGACLLPADGRGPSAALQAVPARRQGRGPAGHRRGSASRSAGAARCFPSASAARQAIRAGCRDAGDGAPRPAVSRVPCGHEAVLDAVQRAGGVLYPVEPIPSPRPSATRRSNPRTANKTARPAASRAASPPSARPTGRRRR